MIRLIPKPWLASTRISSPSLKRQLRRLPSVSPDGALAASASWDGSAGLWSLETGELLNLFDGHNAGVNDVAFSPDGALLYTASTDGSLRSWRLSDGELIRV
ncbi:MAG: hypothetical protein AAFU68_15950, partial [Pseudomonadota bacterium]